MAAREQRLDIDRMDAPSPTLGPQRGSLLAFAGSEPSRRACDEDVRGPPHRGLIDRSVDPERVACDEHGIGGLVDPESKSARSA
jgi:hypothetical protein